MNSWNEGYFTESTYTYGYYRDISPAWQNFCLLLNGFVAPEMNDNSVHCELGFGQGVSANVHAAATLGKYFGTDFNPAQAAFAQELCQASGADAKFFDNSFEEMLNRDDLPQFDSISLHGIWSWISEENQKHIVDFAKKFLKPGGIFYNSYNCYPGWSPAAPMREIFILHDKYSHKSSKTFERIQEALDFTEELLNKNPAYFNRVPDVKGIFDRTKQLDHDYLAHEYFNRDWICMYFADVAEILQAAKLDFACTTEIVEALEYLNFTNDTLEFLNKIDNKIMRTQIKDYFLSRQFRKDIYIRGVRKLSNFEQMTGLLNKNYVLTSTSQLPTSASVPLGKINLSEKNLETVYKYLAGDNYAPKNFSNYSEKIPNVSVNDLINILVVLIQSGNIAPCQSVEVSRRVEKQCNALNKHLCNRAKTSDEVAVLASPVLGCGYPVSRFDKIFISAIFEGKKNVDDIANYSWKIFAEQGLRVTKSSGIVEGAEENIAELKNLVQNFFDSNLPIMKALKIIQ